MLDRKCVAGEGQIAAPHHARSLDSLGDDAGIRLAPEHMTLEALCAAVHDHGEGVAVMADAQKRQETNLTLPERLLPFLKETEGEGWM